MKKINPKQAKSFTKGRKPKDAMSADDDFEDIEFDTSKSEAHEIVRVQRQLSRASVFDDGVFFD